MSKHIGLSRDALAIVEATLTGDGDRAAELVAMICAEPETVPFVFGAFVSLVGVALRTDPACPPDLFVEGCLATIDRAESTGG